MITIENWETAMRSLLVPTAAALLGVIGIGPAAHANLITNGTFVGANHFERLAGSNIAGWTTSSSSNNLTFVDVPTGNNGSTTAGSNSTYPVQRDPGISPAGGNIIQSDGSPSYTAGIYQTISGLVFGESYTLTFYQAGSEQVGFSPPAGTTTTEDWRVSLGTSTLTSATMYGSEGWELETMTFTASATRETLEFLAQGTPTGAPPTVFLSGVSLDPTSVPEPASVALIGVGSILLGAVRRRRRKRG
jgi:hypothetical protein